MATPPERYTDTERFIIRLSGLDHVPTWNEATAMGVELIDFGLERDVLDARFSKARADYSDNYEQLESQGAIHTAEEYLGSLERRMIELADRPGRYHLATGETIQLDPATHQAYRSGWWFNGDAAAITTPSGDRFHHPGIHPEAVVDPTAHVDPTARVEAGAVIGAHGRIGPYVHVGRGAMIDARCIIQEGAWIGPGSELWSRTWVSPGATVGAHSVIGTRTTVGAGARVAQGSQIEPFSRLGTGTTTAANKPRSYRGVQIAGAIDHLMRLDRE